MHIRSAYAIIYLISVFRPYVMMVVRMNSTAWTASALREKLHTVCRCQAKPMCFQSHQVRSMAGGLNLYHQQVPCSSTEKQSVMSQTMQRPMQLWVESPHTCTPTQLKQLPQSDSISDEAVPAASEYSTVVRPLC